MSASSGPVRWVGGTFHLCWQADQQSKNRSELNALERLQKAQLEDVHRKHKERLQEVQVKLDEELMANREVRCTRGLHPRRDPTLGTSRAVAPRECVAKCRRRGCLWDEVRVGYIFKGAVHSSGHLLLAISCLKLSNP